MRVAKAENAAQPDLVQGLFDARLGLVQAVDVQRLGQYAVYGLARVQGAIGVLKDHLHLTTEILATRKRNLARIGTK